MTGVEGDRVLYVAEPIDQSDFGPWRESVAAMVAIAVKRGWLAFRPSRAWSVSSETSIGPEIESLNRAVMAESRAMVAHLPNGVPSVGVPREVEWAVAHGIPTLVVTDRPGWSLHDVETIEVGDAPGFGLWLQKSAEIDPMPGYPLPFQLDDNGILPTRANLGDAGYDLYVSEDTVIAPGAFVDVPCGVRVAMPPGVWGRITGRSSTRRKRGLLVIEGVIDTGYRGPLYAGVQSLVTQPEIVRKGERIAQLVLHENVAAKHFAIEVDRGRFRRIPGDGRGEAGFGSTGD